MLTENDLTHVEAVNAAGHNVPLEHLSRACIGELPW